MNWIRPRELQATFGSDRLLLLWVIFVFSFGPALAVGSAAQLRSTGLFAIALCTAGAFVITLVAGQSISRFRIDASELRLPRYRGAVLRSYAWLLCLTLALPILMLWIIAPAERYWICITLIAPLGLLQSKLLTGLRSHERSRPSSRMDAPGFRARSPSEIIRMFVGRAYAPVPVRSREFIVRLLLVMFWSVPLAFTLISTQLIWSVLYLSFTAISGWIWFLNSLGLFVRDRLGAFGELGLLPGLGNASTQRRGLYVAVLTPPIISMACLIGVGLLIAHLKGCSADRIVRTGIGCGLLLIYCVVGLLQQLLTKRAVTTKVALLMPSIMPLVFAPPVLQITADFWRSPNAVVERLLFMSLLLATVVAIFLIWIYTRSLSERPHPFLEIAPPFEMEI